MALKALAPTATAARAAAATETRARRWLNAAAAVSATSVRSIRRAAMSAAAESDKATLPFAAVGALDDDDKDDDAGGDGEFICNALSRAAPNSAMRSSHALTVCDKRVVIAAKLEVKSCDHGGAAVIVVERNAEAP